MKNNISKKILVIVGVLSLSAFQPVVSADFSQLLSVQQADNGFLIKIKGGSHYRNQEQYQRRGRHHHNGEQHHRRGGHHRNSEQHQRRGGHHRNKKDDHHIKRHDHSHGLFHG